MIRPIVPSSAAYAASCRSKARHAAPIERAAQSLTRAGSARITPIGRPPLLASVRLVEVAALQEVEVAVVVLDSVVELEEVLHDLGAGVALRPGVIGERQDDEL